MVLELHIWGPAFGLPSIDPECLSVIVYLVQAFESSDWVLIPTGDPSTNPTGRLPALRPDTLGVAPWIAGFDPIVEFLMVTQDLDVTLNHEQRADSYAWCTFIRSKAKPLIDLYLYVSNENYAQYTRPALSQILQWPQQWVVPPRLRERAIKATDHLGLSSPDIQALRREGGGDSNRHALGSMTPVPLDTISTSLSRKGRKSQFRLDTATNDFMSQISTLLEKYGSLSWVNGTAKATTLDCVLLGHLMLMCAPAVPPHRWLHDAMGNMWLTLDAWTMNFRVECFGVGLHAADIMAMAPPDPGIKNLPWYPRTAYTPSQRLLKVVAGISAELPFSSAFQTAPIVPRKT